VCSGKVLYRSYTPYPVWAKAFHELNYATPEEIKKEIEKLREEY
jgi:hypothetical protein